MQYISYYKKLLPILTCYTIHLQYSATKLNNNEQVDNPPKGYGVTIGLLFQIFNEWGNVLKSKN